jgi:hypothetical protein
MIPVIRKRDIAAYYFAITWRWLLRPALLVAVCCVLGYGTWFGVVRWVESLPDPQNTVSVTGHVESHN